MHIPNKITESFWLEIFPVGKETPLNNAGIDIFERVATPRREASFLAAFTLDSRALIRNCWIFLSALSYTSRKSSEPKPPDNAEDLTLDFIWN